MNTEALAKEINDLLATETRSLLSHLDEAHPHVDARTYPIWKRIRAICRHDEEAHADRLTDLLASLNLPQPPGSFGQDVGHFHYMTVESLLPRLVEEKRRQVQGYERAVQHAHREPIVAATLASLLDENRAELEQLESLAAGLGGNGDATPIEQTADLQNIANVQKMKEALAAAKGA